MQSSRTTACGAFIWANTFAFDRMKQALQLKLSQHLTLTPQLQQSIRLLQLSTVELEQEIEQILHENPLLEREDDTPTYAGTEQPVIESLPDQFGPQGVEAESMRADREFSAPAAPRDDDDEPAERQNAAAVGLREHLLAQLGQMQLSARDRALAGMLAEALDDDGYLTQSLDEVLALLPPELDIELEKLHLALRMLQACEPPGIAARNLAECLLLQIHQLPPSPERSLAQRIVGQHMDLLASRDFSGLKRICRCDDEDLKYARDLILGLNPRPGAAFSTADIRYVTPDVILRKLRNKWQVHVNPSAVPRLKLNRLYADILSRERGRAVTGDNGGLFTQLQEAKWLLKNVQQRFETIERVAQAIVDRQRHFFDYGEVAMRPLVLREIADKLGLHESTISRVTTNKYLLTPRGIFELKYFFGSHVTTDTGGACSSTAIRALIRLLVTAEDLKKPLSDSKIATVLGQQGIVVARRTIAKYREALKIPPANLRKSL